MKKSADKIDPDDAALFRETVRDVKPLPKQNRIPPQAAPRKPFRHSAAVPDSIPDMLSDFAPEETADEYLGNGLSRMTLRNLRRGHWPVRDRLDLHGLNVDAARKLLQEFLHEAVQHEARCVLVVHGKGINSRSGEAVLRKLARHWLTQHPGVLAWCNAPPQEGGSGAVLVLLRTSA